MVNAACLGETRSDYTIQFVTFQEREHLEEVNAGGRIRLGVQLFNDSLAIGKITQCRIKRDNDKE